MARIAKEKVFLWVAFLCFLCISYIGVASINSATSSEMEALLRRTRAEKLGFLLPVSALNYQLEAKDGERIEHVALKDLDAPLMLVNFWATFCQPCIEELPSLLAMSRMFQDKGLLVLAISYDDSFDTIEDFFNEFTSATIPKNFIVLRDPQPGGGEGLKGVFGTKKIPETYIVEGQKVLVRFVNARNWTEPDIIALFNGLLEK
jgi:thiol-disulfide isomerase/thioredoxin